MRPILAFGLVAFTLAFGAAPSLAENLPARSCRVGKAGRCLPHHAYGTANPRLTVTTVSFPAINDQLIQVSNQTRMIKLAQPNTSKPIPTIPAAPGSILADPRVQQIEPSPLAALATQVELSPPSDKAEPTIVRRKRFVAGSPPLEAGPVHLTDLGLAIYETGEIDCTATASHDGGPFGAILGNHIAIEVIAFAGQFDPTIKEPAGPGVWRSRRELWLNRDQPRVISLVDGAASDHLRLHFDEITRLQLNLEVISDR